MNIFIEPTNTLELKLLLRSSYLLSSSNCSLSMSKPDHSFSHEDQTSEQFLQASSSVIDIGNLIEASLFITQTCRHLYDFRYLIIPCHYPVIGHSCMSSGQKKKKKNNWFGAWFERQK